MDEDIQQLIAARDHRAAFDLLVNRYRDKVYRLAQAMLRNTGLAEEVSQDAFLKVWRSLPAYDGRASPATWLYAITRNTCLSRIRYEGLRASVPLNSLNGAAPPSDLSDVRKLVDELPDPQRTVVVLFYLEEKSYDEVAAMLEMPLGTVKSHLYRARRALAERMK